MVCSFITGYLSEKLEANMKNYILSAVSGLIVLHILGIPYYYFISHNIIENNLSFNQIFLFCFVYTFPFDFLLSILGAKLALRLKPLLSNGEK